MIDITVEQIRAAADSDLTAISEVLTALEPRIGQLANKYATNGGHRNHDLAEELEQEGRIAAWQCIERFEGDSVAQFFTYIDRSLKGVMDDNRRIHTRQGVSEDTARRFERCLTVCAGDPYAAQAEAVRPDGCLGRERMTPETAYASRLAWQGVEYLDAPVGTGESTSEKTTLGDRLADRAEPEFGFSESDRTRAIKRQVHETLGRLGRQQAFVLSATHGVDPVGQMESDRQIAEALDIAEPRITSIRSRGYSRFRELYLAGADAGQVRA
jgi:RNA polymerase sigma factor (sigma-70 family)